MSIEIYTISGEVVNTFNHNNLPGDGYGDYFWDLKNTDGPFDGNSISNILKRMKHWFQGNF